MLTLGDHPSGPGRTRGGANPHHAGRAMSLSERGSPPPDPGGTRRRELVKVARCGMGDFARLKISDTAAQYRSTSPNDEIACTNNT